MGAIPVSSRWAALSETSKFDMGPKRSPAVEDLGDVESDKRWLLEWVNAIIRTAKGGAAVEAQRQRMKLETVVHQPDAREAEGPGMPGHESRGGQREPQGEQQKTQEIPHAGRIYAAPR